MVLARSEVAPTGALEALWLGANLAASLGRSHHAILVGPGAAECASAAAALGCNVVTVEVRPVLAASAVLEGVRAKPLKG